MDVRLILQVPQLPGQASPKEKILSRIGSIRY